jgi:hypothetical protein
VGLPEWHIIEESDFIKTDFGTSPKGTNIKTNCNNLHFPAIICSLYLPIFAAVKR